MLKAQVAAADPARPDEAEEVEGQVAVMQTRARIRRVELVPSDVPADPVALAAIEAADQVLLAPGSLFTSVLPVLMVPEIRAAVAAGRWIPLAGAAAVGAYAYWDTLQVANTAQRLLTAPVNEIADTE